MGKREIRYTKTIGIRLTPAEYDGLVADAKHCEMTVGEYVRRCTYGQVVHPELRKIRRECNSLGVLANQLTKKANQKGHDTVIYEAMRDIVKAMLKTAKRFDKVAV